MSQQARKSGSSSNQRAAVGRATVIAALSPGGTARITQTEVDGSGSDYETDDSFDGQWQ